MCGELLYKIYKELLKHFGPQGWWPIAGIYNPKKKSFSDKEKFEIMTGAILTQNTSWNNVEKALANLRKENFLDIYKISRINLKKLQKLIKPSGFYKQKAIRLKNFAISVQNRLKQVRVLENITREVLLSINGIGPETADSIMLYALGKPYFVVDAYTKRLTDRLGIFKGKDYDEIQRYFEKNIPRRVNIYREYHALIVELAKRFCRKKPECGAPLEKVESTNSVCDIRHNPQRRIKADKNCPILRNCMYGKKWKP
ncbi:MAG: endonuclease III domain-containing protein [Elusimicrobia bacterium]|nr:endonuclease III domain-containing protein [Elusimicrobiota bacterium]